MRPLESSTLTVEKVQDMVRRELSTPTRIGYSLLGLFTLTAAGLIATLWLTEPGPLPMRTHVAFGLLVAINLAWSALFGWVVTRRKVLYAMHSVIAGWMAVAFCSLFLLLGLAIAWTRMNTTALVAVGLLGTVHLLVAIALLRHAQHRRRALLARRDELTSKLAQHRQT